MIVIQITFIKFYGVMNMSKKDLEFGNAVVKKKKLFFLRWWFILLAVIAVLIVMVSISNMGEKIEWDNMVLGEMLPEPPNDRGEIFNNDSEELRIDIEDVSAKEYVEYVSLCEKEGFVVESKNEANDFSAYNANGYKLSIDYLESASEMGITLKKPMEMNAITWPTSTAGKQLPSPKSTIGKFSYEYDDDFFVYVGNTSKADYVEYVNACSENGFNIDYSKGDDYYYADNNEGWHVDICYEGNNIMSINIDAPSDDDNEGDTPSDDASTQNSKPDTTEKESNNEIDDDFKVAMDSYEKFMNDYVDFMKKYKANLNR